MSLDLSLKVFILSIFLGCLASTVVAKELYDFFVDRMTCEDADPRIMYNISCSSKSRTRILKTHNLLLYTLPNTNLNEIFVRVVYNQKINAVFRPFIINTEENFCGFLAGTAKSNLIRILWPMLLKTSNLKTRCPYSGVFNISNLVFEDTFLPPVLPEGQGRIDIHVRNGPQRMSLIHVKFYINVKPKGAANLNF